MSRKYIPPILPRSSKSSLIALRSAGAPTIGVGKVVFKWEPRETANKSVSFHSVGNCGCAK